MLWPRGRVWHHTLQDSVEKSVMHLSFPGRCSWLWSCWRRGLRLGQWCVHFPAPPPHPYICLTLGGWNGQEETPGKATLPLARGQLREVVGVLETRSVQGEREEGEHISGRERIILTDSFNSNRTFLISSLSRFAPWLLGQWVLNLNLFFNSMTLMTFIFYCSSDDVQVVLISAIWQSDSVFLYIYIYVFLSIFFSIMVHHRILNIVPYATQ